MLRNKSFSFVALLFNIAVGLALAVVLGIISAQLPSGKR